MGCTVSKLATPESSHSSSRQTVPVRGPSAAGQRAGGTNLPMTRDRIDSWAVNGQQPEPGGSPTTSSPTRIASNNSGGSPPTSGQGVQQLAAAASRPPLAKKQSSPPQAALQQQPTVESQWKFLWETHSPQLLDPADVHSVLDALLCQTINKLSPVEITLLQRKVRSTVRATAATTTQTKPRAVFTAVAKTDTDTAQNVVERHHLLTESLVTKILPPSSIQRNAYLIMLHLSETLWDRVADVAVLTATKAHLEMDVNQRQASLRMPKPSVVPDVSPAEVPPGVSMLSLSFVLAVARRGTRNQRLVLLFYLLVDRLEDFLATHPAGGVPTWLLEVDQETVISLASLTHYHYFGHGGYLPVPNLQAPPFCASNSRQPLTIQMSKLRELIQSTLMPATTATTPTTATLPAQVNGESAVELDVNSTTTLPLPTSLRRNSKTRTIVPRQSSEGSHTESKLVDGESVLETPYYPNTLPMKKLAAAWDQGMTGEANVTVSSSLLEKLQLPAEEPDGSPSRKKRRAPNGSMSLQRFAKWADEALDDSALAVLLCRLFTFGILPTAEMEKELVQEKWREWRSFFDALALSGNSGSPNIPNQDVASLPCSTLPIDGDEDDKMMVLSGSAWGGIAGIDGGGAIGYGVLYCIDKQWWDHWTKYVGWSFIGERPCNISSMSRPAALSTERLLDNQKGSVLRGIMGSYEHMKQELTLNVDYILIPPGVWDTLYELYGGGPPLPRIVKPFRCEVSGLTGLCADAAVDGNGNLQQDDELDRLIQGVDTAGGQRVQNLPDNLSVALHPWILHVLLCDPSQPYRRGDAGLQAIRIMTVPDAPLWRLLAEIVLRLPLHAYKAFGVDKRGKCRLWKKCEQGDVSATRYGPWNLLSKGRHAIVPLLGDVKGLGEQCMELSENWKAYADNATVKSIGLRDRDHVMFEFAVLNRNSDLVWPREAAAQAGKVRRLAEEDAKFRALLQGVDEKGEPLIKPVNLCGVSIDAMDTAGRWYPVTILEADIVDEEAEEDGEETYSAERKSVFVSRKKVRVDFTLHNGHQEWIDVDSDRLAILGRFTSDAEDQMSTTDAISNGVISSDSKSKSIPPVKKALATENGPENGKICPWPGFGACGLTNLGNTCYSNAAIQCMSYLPVLRSYLLSVQYKTAGDLNKDNPLGTGGKLLEEFADLLRALWSAKTGEKSPSRFRSQLGKLNPQFAGADQQDAQEFLNYILDMLHEDSNRVRTKPYVEAVNDDWVKYTGLSRVGDETWRRFLRRNRSIMTDVAMGQVLNTVTCPVCQFTSKNFDPFNLLSIPIPTVADVVFRCTVFRRVTALNCPWVLDRPRKGEKVSKRFAQRSAHLPSGPPSEKFSAEEYILAVSRLADLGDIRLRLQNVCGIPAHQLRLCRVDISETAGKDKSPIVCRQVKVRQLNDKEGPCSQLAKKRLPGEKGIAAPTHIIAFESTLRSRTLPPTDSKNETLEDTADEDDELDVDDNQQLLPTPREQAEIEKYLHVYGDDQECRLFDTNPLVIAKAISRSLWPQLEHELKLGLRVDAKDQRGNWFPGNVVELIADANVPGDGNGAAQQSTKVRVHFDNFSSKWDELYGIEDFQNGRVKPLHAHSAPRPKPTEFVIHHRYTDSMSGRLEMFGQSFYVQCQNDWSNARAGAHILAQASKFICQTYGSSAAVRVDDNSSASNEAKVRRLNEKSHAVISDLIDLLIDCDREYVRLALGVSEHNTDEEKRRPYRNPLFDPTPLSATLVKKVGSLVAKLPFEVRVTTSETGESDTNSGAVEEAPFPFSLIRTIGNYMNARHLVVLHWREPPVDKKIGSMSNNLGSPVMYSEPVVAVDEASARGYREKVKSNQDIENLGRPGHAGIDLGVCLTEFCKVQSLAITDNWCCPHCKEFREGQQSMNLWRLPDLLTFHIKRFNMSARWREKITTKVNFPLTGLDMSEWFHEESPMTQTESGDSSVYDLIGAVNHYGSMTGGHYIAICKASACGREGQEEVAYSFNGVGATTLEDGVDSDIQSGWRLGRSKAEVNHNKLAAATGSQAASESAEPLWLQFDDELVEPIAPEHVVSEMAYVLFYRRRRMTPSNIAKYSTLD